jgi:DNA segregation ATPase FtsK/SpoIIIE-like protein
MKSECQITRETDEFYPLAIALAEVRGEVSVSMIQRNFRLGYNRSSRIVEAMDDLELLGPVKISTALREYIGDKPKMTREEALQIIEDFGKAGGNLFFDGCTGLTDKDIICIAKDCQILLKKVKRA